MLINRALKIRIYPTAAQEKVLGEWERALRWLWNLCVEQRRPLEVYYAPEEKDEKTGKVTKWQVRGPTDRVTDVYDRKPKDGKPASVGTDVHTTRPKPDKYSGQKDVTVLRAELPWLAEVPCTMCQAVVHEHDAAWERYRRRIVNGRPKFKSAIKGQCAAMKFGSPSGITVKPNAIRLPKLGDVRAFYHKEPNGRLLNASITRDIDRWWISLSLEIQIEDPISPPKEVVAINRGCVDLIGDSDGRVVEGPKFLEQKLRRLAIEQQKLSRMVYGSSNWTKQNRKVAKLHRLVRLQRQSFAHQLTTEYAREYKRIIIEDYKIKDGMVGKDTPTNLNRMIHDAGWGMLGTQLTYKSEAFGGVTEKYECDFISQTCPVNTCGHLNEKNHPSATVFVCQKCGHTENADVVAAKNLLTRAESQAHKKVVKKPRKRMQTFKRMHEQKREKAASVVATTPE